MKWWFVRCVAAFAPIGCTGGDTGDTATCGGTLESLCGSGCADLDLAYRLSTAGCDSDGEGMFLLTRCGDDGTSWALWDGDSLVYDTYYFDAEGEAVAIVAHTDFPSEECEDYATVWGTVPECAAPCTWGDEACPLFIEAPAACVGGAAPPE